MTLGSVGNKLEFGGLQKTGEMRRTHGTWIDGEINNEVKWFADGLDQVGNLKIMARRKRKRLLH